MRREEGQASVELALVLPLVMALVLSGVQVALWFHAAQVATAAAQEGAAAARAAGADAGAGRRAATDTLAQLGPHLLGSARIEVSTDAERVRVRVRGQAVAVVPGLHLGVEGRAESPVERLWPETQR